MWKVSVVVTLTKTLLHSLFRAGMMCSYSGSLFSLELPRVCVRVCVSTVNLTVEVVTDPNCYLCKIGELAGWDTDADVLYFKLLLLPQCQRAI